MKCVTRLAACACALALLPGCGDTDKAVGPLISKVDQARDARALSSLQQSLVAAAVVRAESGGSYAGRPEDLAQGLQARDPSKRFGVAPSSGPEELQVLGGQGGALMLVVRSSPDAHLAAWDDGAVTLYYRGVEPPAYTAQRPGGAGWTDTPPGP